MVLLGRLHVWGRKGKLETRNQKLESADRKLEIGKWKLKVLFSSFFLSVSVAQW
jgi:hypothetical protein